MAESDRPSKKSSKKPPTPPPTDGTGPFGDGWEIETTGEQAAAADPGGGEAFPELDNIFTEMPVEEVFANEATGVGAIPVELDDEMTSEPDLFGNEQTAMVSDHTDEIGDLAVAPPRRERVATPPPPSPSPPPRRERNVTPPPFDEAALGPTASPRSRPAPPPPSPAVQAMLSSESPSTTGSSRPSATQPATQRARAKPPRPSPVEDAFEEAAAAPPPADDEERTIFNDNTLFRSESQRLARVRDWQKLAAITSAAADESSGATWANVPETRSALLGDLARIYRDRLKDLPSAEDTFRRLAALEPANPDAIDFLSGRYRSNGDWKALYDLYGAAIEPTWDPNLRLEWTRETVAIATDKLGSPDLAIESWERLWRLGDAVEETSRALSEVYRRARRWDRLAEFLAKRAAQLAGAERIVALREIAEAYLSGLRDQDQAATVLEQILAERADDPIALLALARVLARRKDWEALAELGARPLEGLSPTAVLDFRRLVADALWSSGDLERAALAHDRVLELDPEDADSLKAKEEYLARTGRSEVLVNFLAGRADRAKTDEERGNLLSRAAQLAERELDDPRQAVALWEKRATIESGRLQAHEALVNLYESLGDLPGVARALEGQLALTRSPAARIELLRRLGEHSAHRMGDDVRAEACWQEIVAIVPDDRTTRDELIGLHRRRGDFEALDRALSGQAWRAVDEAEVLGCWRAAAKNVDDNIADPRRAIRSWLRVVDHAPADGDALRALAERRRALVAQGESPRALIAALEDELRVTVEPAVQIERTLEIARLWEAAPIGERSEVGAASTAEAPPWNRAAALAAYERVLRASPGEPSALSAVARLRGAAEAGAAIGAFDVAGSDEARPSDERIALQRQGVALLDAGDALGRFFGLRRILWLADRSGEVLAEVARAAVEAGAWSDLAAVYATVAAEATDGAVRAAAHRELAAIFEERLKDPVRAFLVLQAIGQHSVDDPKHFDALVRLSVATGRHEDLLALLDVAARTGASLDGRRDAMRRRAVICEGQLKDPERAFHECARQLWLTPGDADALADARRLAAMKGMWRPLDALLAELSDRAGTVEKRVELAQARHAIRTDHLNDPIGALDQLLVIYRLAPDRPGLVEQLFAAADALKAWERVLPVVEARVRSVGESASPDELARIAALHEEKRGDAERAFELYAEAFVLRPSWADLKEKLERLAAKTSRFELLSICYRIAAARSGDPAQTLDLYRRIAALYDEKLKQPEDALEVHRRILHLQPSALPSLEAVIDHHRTKGKTRDLRDRLQQWIERAPGDAPGRVARFLEIARVSRESLADPETALATYAQILEVEPANEEALAGVRSLTEGPIDPTLELRRQKIELRRATPERRVEILLACAKLQEEQLDDLDGATATLRLLIEETGAAGPGFAPLERVLRQRASWSELVDLIESRAAVVADGAGRIAALEQAFTVCDEHPAAAPVERRERLYRRMLEERPGDVATQRHLLQLYRDAARYQDLATLLRATLQALPQKGAGEQRALYESELARVLDRGLGQAAEAEAVLAARAARDPDDGEVLLDLASLKLRRGDFAGYLALREQQAKRLPPQLGALVLCHLAEACDETAGQQAKVPNYYREARTLDPTNPPAMEALKAIGRRAKSWRATAALLPDPDEAKLPWPERAARLRARGDAASNTDLAQGLSWYQRAVAVDPDHYAAWDALALVHTAQNDAASALDAERASLAAFERATGPEPARLREHAERIQQLADARKATGDSDGAAGLSQRAYQLQPSFAIAALAVADVKLAAGETEAAYAIFDRVLRDHEAGDAKLADHERLHATFQRGALAAKLNRVDQAINDLREGLRIEPLHSGVLNALADAYATKDRVAAAIQHYTQALLVEHDYHHRGALYARLGRLWEDRLSRPDEAGVCYDLAVAAGIHEGDLMLRALRHYRRSGRPERALQVIERLLPSTTEPRELAALWTERGGILAATDEDHAIEAYDMALSYDPGNQTALSGLSTLLEKRGDWEQLLQIFEARTESGGPPEERAEALRSLARIASGHLKDPVRTERYLRQAIELAPTKADYEQLLLVYGDDPKHAQARRGVIAGLLTISGPFMPRVIELGRMLATQGDRRWAWCLLSPLMNSTMPEPTLKTLVLELRKEFEKSDNTGVLSPKTHRLVRHPDVDEALLDVLAELDAEVVLGRTSAEECGGSGVGKLDERTAVGKTFAAIAAKLGMEGATLLRAQELPEPFAVLDLETPHVAVRAELLQLLSVAETGFLFATMLESARAGARVVNSLPAAERPLLVAALLYAVGLAGASDAATAALGDKIKAGANPERLAAWALRLREVAAQGRPDLGARLASGVVETARRVGLVAAADLRFVARLLTRIDESLPKLPTVGKLDDLDEFIGGAAPVRTLLGFAATDAFGTALAG